MTGQWQTEAVWKSLLHYDSLQRYYMFVGKRLARRRRWFAYGVLTASSGAVVTLLAGQPQEVAEVLAGVVAALTIWSELADYSGKSARSLSLAADLSHLATAMHALWVGLDELNADEAEQAWRELDARATEMTRHVPAELLEYPSLQDQAEEETYGYWDQEQGAAVAKL